MKKSYILRNNLLLSISFQLAQDYVKLVQTYFSQKLSMQEIDFPNQIQIIFMPQEALFPFLKQSNKNALWNQMQKLDFDRFIFETISQESKIIVTDIIMHYSQHSQVKPEESRKSGKLHSAIEKAQAIQQREQLRQMVTDKFQKDFAKGNKNISKIIDDIVADFFLNEKVTEDTLRQLKGRVSQAVGEYRKNSQSAKGSSVRSSQVSAKELRQREDDAKSQVSQKSNVSQQSQKSGRSKNSATSSSVTSSVASKSVYQVQGDDEDEWATLVKFDTQLFKKEKELERIREEEFKKKMKRQLDKQLEEKKRRKAAEQNEQMQFKGLQEEQIKAYDQREKDKKEEYERKIMLEKKMRDKQIKDENKRKKNEKRKEDQLDALLVEKIKEQIQDEENQMRRRKDKERERFLQLMVENEENQRRLRDQADRERIQDVKAQEEYMRLQDELERKREEEKKEREQKIKKVMASFADSVIKDQKEQIRAEDQKMMRHIENQLQREKQDEQRRKHEQNIQKAKMREYLAKQVEEKKQKEIAEKQIDYKQAEVWKEDTSNFFNTQKQKQDYLKNIHKQHEEILKAQMQDKEDKKKRKKMNTLELLYNKALMKAAAEEDGQVKKTKV